MEETKSEHKRSYLFIRWLVLSLIRDSKERGVSASEIARIACYSLNIRHEANVWNSYSIKAVLDDYFERGAIKAINAGRHIRYVRESDNMFDLELESILSNIYILS
jgi:hypothetical protein